MTRARGLPGDTLELRPRPDRELALELLSLLDDLPGASEQARAAVVVAWARMRDALRGKL